MIEASCPYAVQADNKAAVAFYNTMGLAEDFKNNVNTPLPNKILTAGIIFLLYCSAKRSADFISRTHLRNL